MTQVNFRFPHSVVTYGNGQPITGEAQHGNQLKFNLGTPLKDRNLESKFRKPQPIVIEKLAPLEVFSEPVAVNGSIGPTPFMPTNLSSERLSFAIQLAKMDMRRLKQMTPTVVDSLPQEQAAKPTKVEKKLAPDQEFGPAKSKVIFTNQRRNQKDKVLEAKSKGKPFNKIVNIRSPTQRKDEPEKKIDVKKNKDSSEISRLRKELQTYMHRLDEIVDNQGTLNNKKDNKNILEEDELLRLNSRAEEQASRSARMLYVLQRKVQEIQDELDKQTSGPKPTKKSQTMSRLAAAHRSAVRALQMFVKHAPLYYDTQRNLPHSYLELTSLIKQLSLLSSQFNLDTDLGSLDTDLLSKLELTMPNQKRPKKPQIKDRMQTGRGKSMTKPQIRLLPPSKHATRKPTAGPLNRYKTWFQQRAGDLRLDEADNDVDTPERQSSLKAGWEALERINGNYSFVGGDFNEPRQSLRKTVDQQQYRTNARKPGVLNPSFKPPLITKPARRKSERVEATSSKTHFADATVSSILKTQEIKPYKPRKPVFMEIPINNYNSPERPFSSNRRKNSELVKEKFIQKRHGGKFAPQDHEMAEKEIRRQAWLEKEQEIEAMRLRHLREENDRALQDQRHMYEGSKEALSHVEGVIRSKLEPLLVKAEKLADEERKREDDYKNSVRKRLAQIASNTVLSQAELLSELILDDLLLETADELQRLEEDEELDTDIAMQKSGVAVNHILEHLNKYEREENEIRRRWRHLQYTDLDNFHSSEPKSGKQLAAEEGDLRRHEIRPSASLIDTSMPLDVTASIFRGRHEYENFIKNQKSSSISSPQFVKICELFLNDLFGDVAAEVEGILDGYVDNIYEQEFVKDSSHRSDS